MLYYLKAKDGSTFYLLPDETYTVGRKECNLVLKDSSVSRSHSKISVKVNDVSVTDCGSTYGTFIDDTKLKVNKWTKLQEGNVIKFGLMTSIYTFNQVHVVTTTSGISRDLKTKLTKNISAIGGTLLQNWTKQCTHVTVEEIYLTVKVLSAVIMGTPIVTVEYWTEYVDAVKTNQPIPNPLNYLPKCSEVILRHDLSFEYKEERKQLFSNKIFVFALKNDRKRMNSLIELAGGESISWEESPLPIEGIQEKLLKKYVIIQTAESCDTSKIDKAFLTFINEYTATGQSTVSLQDIALAIIECSCEKHCNPNFNRKALVFKTSPPESEQNLNKNLLAPPTQSLDICDMSEEIKTELVIPQTCDLTTKLEIVEEPLLKMEDNSNEDCSTTTTIPWSLKRNSTSDHNGNSTKKLRVEESLSSTTVNKSLAVAVAKPVEERSDASSVKPLFALRYENIAKTEPSTSYINPFAKKRKAQDDISNQTKKPTFLSNTTVSSPSTTPKMVVNPFSNIIKSRKRNTSEDVKFTLTPTESNTDTARNNVNSLEINFSEILAVDDALEKSVQWLTRSEKSIANLMDQDKDVTDMDNELLVFINSFKNSVIVAEEKGLIVRKPGEWNVTNQSLNDSNVKNFKRFHKVQPFRIQTTIVPESNYVSVVCNQRAE